MRSIRDGGWRAIKTAWPGVLALAMSLLITPCQAAPYPPAWNGGTVNEASGPIHFAPVPWPNEPANPVDCGVNCGDWKPYTRFQGQINDPRVQDPSNGGTAPQNYVNVSSSCIDKRYPSIYYYLHKGAAANGSQDVILFRWRVEQIAHNYATGPSAGNYAATDPWSSGLWTVLFDIDGDGYRDLAAHLNGSSGDPSHAIDMIAGVWGQLPTQSVDYLSDPAIHLIAHNPTAFTSGSTILNFHDSLAPDTNWADIPIGSRRSWDYGSTRGKLVYTNSCNEYFVDYQIPVRMLDASATGPNPSLNGPKITRNTPISMLFCTANSLNNPFQKDCSLNRAYLGDDGKPGPFGDYLSFSKDQPFSQPIVSSVKATPPNSCPGNYQLQSTVQDTLYVDASGVIKTSVKSVKFYYWYDRDGDGTTAGDTGSTWQYAADGTLATGSLNSWTASWNPGSLPKGRYLIGVQAVDDRTLHDDGVADAPIDNRTFSYLVGSTTSATQAQIYITPWSFDNATKTWVSGGAGGWIGTGADDQQALFPAHTPAITAGSSENWYGNPDVTGVQTALISEAINACGVAPTLLKSASATSVTAGGEIGFTLTFTNPVSNTSAITLTQLSDVLPTGFSYKAGSTTGAFGSTEPGVTGQSLSWSGSVSVPAGGSAALSFTAIASSVIGTYANTASAASSFGSTDSNPVEIGVGAPRLTLSKTVNLASTAPGNELTYTLSYANDATVSVTGAVLSDTLPTGLSYVAASCTGGCSYDSGTRTLSWALGSLGAGTGPFSVSFKASVDSPYTGSASNQNTASLTSNETAAVQATASVYVDTPRPQLVIRKTASSSLVAPGSNVTFTLSYGNAGNAAATSAVLSDALPSGFTFVSASPTASSAPAVGANGTVSWNLGSLAASSSGSVTVTAQAGNPFTGTLNPALNTASLAASGQTTVSDSAEVGVSQSGNVCRTYYMTGTQGNVGFDGNQYLATTATPSGGTTIIQKLADDTVTSGIIEIARFYQDPVSSQLVSFNGSSTLSGQLYYTKSNALGGAANSNSTLYLTVYDYDPATGNRVQIAQSSMADNGAPTPPVTLANATPTGQLAKGHRLLIVMGVDMAANKATTINLSANSTQSYVQVCATPPANLMLEKTVDTTAVYATGSGRSLSYTLSYANTSSATAATNASIVETLPAGLTLTSSTLNGSPITPTGSNPYTYALGTVAAGGSGTLVLNANIANDLGSATALVNSAQIQSDQTALSPTGGATATTTVVGATSNPAGTPHVVLDKQVNASRVGPGDTVSYTLTALNTGDKTATSVAITDDFPDQSYFSYVSCTASSGSCSEAGGVLSWNVSSLAPGEKVSLTLTMAVGATPPSGLTSLSNQASATYAGGGTGTASSNAVIVAISTNPALTLSKSVSPLGTRAPGDLLTYTLSVSNTGSAAADSVVVADPLPANTHFKGGITASQGSGSFDAINNRVLFQTNALAAGATATFSFQAQVNSPLANGTTSITNSASVTAANAASRQASVASTVVASPALTLSKTGPASLPSPATTLSATASSQTSVFVASTANLSVGQYVRIGGTIARIDAMTASSLTLDTAVSAAAGSAVVPSATYILSYQNTGTADAASVVLTDTLPAGWLFVAASPTATSAPAQGNTGTVSWSLGSVTAGGGGSVQLTAIPAGAGSSTNTATLSDPVYCTGAPLPGGCSAMATTNVGGLLLSKATTTPVVAAGGVASWTITVTNTLNSPVTGVSVTDSLPAGFTYAATGSILAPGATQTANVTPSAGSAQPVWGTWTLPALGSLSIPFTANVSANAGAAIYQNDVSLTSSTPGVGMPVFDPLATSAEDVTVLGAGTGIVTGTVYRDTNGNGTFDASSDTPLPGIAVTLIDANGISYVAYTDAGGQFRRVVAAGSVVVDVDDSTLPAALVLTAGADGIDPSSITVPDGGTASRDTGYIPATGSLGAIRGHIWLDSDADGVLDGGEADLLGVEVVLRDASTNAVIARAYTDVLGQYSFPNVPVGNYRVDVVPTGSRYVSTANSPSSVSVSAGATTTVNFGLAQGQLLSGVVFRDNGAGGGTAADGLQNGSEAGSNAGGGLYVVVLSSAQQVVALSSVPASGVWSASVASGTGYAAYLTDSPPSLGQTVTPVVSLPASWSVTKESAGGVPDGSADGKLLAINATSDVSNLLFGVNSAITTYSLSGTVFVDANGNGLWAAPEAGTTLTGTVVMLADSGNNFLASTAIGADGSWSFTGLADGSYSVRLSTNTGFSSGTVPNASLPTGWFATGEAIGAGGTDGTADSTISVTISGGNVVSVRLGIRQQADVLLQKNAPAMVPAAGSLRYALSISNAGPGDASGSTINDPVPAGVSGMTWSCVVEAGAATCPASNGTGALAHTLTALPAGSRLVFNIQATAPASGSVTNTASVSPPASVLDPDPGNNTGATTTLVATPAAIADLSVLKYAPASVAANAPITYEIVVSNAGPSAADNAIIADTTNATSWTCYAAAGGASCPQASGSGPLSATIASFPAGGSLRYRFVAASAASGNVSNTVTVTAPATVTDPNPGNNTASVSTVIAASTGSADLVLNKTGATSASAGAVVTYELLASNLGPTDVTGARILDDVPTALSNVSWTCSAGNGALCGSASGTGQSVNTLVDLAVGTSVRVTVTGTAPASASSWLNLARIVPPIGTDDPDPANNVSGAVLTSVLPSPDIFTTVTTPALVAAGSVINAQVSFGNQGELAAQGLSYQLQLPAGLSGVSCQSASCLYNPANGVITISGLPGSLSPGESLVIGVTYPAPAGVAQSIVLGATITTTSSNETPTANNTASGSTTTGAAAAGADVSVTISAPPSAAAGSTVETAVRYTNLGDANATSLGFNLSGLPAATVITHNGLICAWNNGTGALTGCGLPSTLPIGQAIHLIARYTAPASGSVVATATVSAATDSNPANNTAAATTTIPGTLATPEADLTAGIAAPGSTTVGSTVLATLSFGNLGPSSANNVSYSLTIGSGASNPQIRYQGVLCNYAGGAITGCGLPTSLAAGQTVNLALSLTAPATAGSFALVASTSTSTLETSLTNNSASTLISVSASTPSGSISGRIWYDLNLNGRVDTGEAGRANWPVELLQGGMVIARVQSNANGNYAFAGVADGIYSVRFFEQAGLGATPVNGESGTPIAGGGIPGQSILSNIVVSPSARTVTQQSLPIDPSGVVYDSTTRLPIAGALVTLSYTCGAMDPTWVMGGTTTLTTPASGAYAFFLLPGAPNACDYQLSVSRTGYTFASTTIPPQAGAWPAGGGSISGVSGAPAPSANTVYYLRGPKPSADLYDNNLPLDPVVAPPPPPPPPHRAIPILSPFAIWLLAVLLVAATVRARTRRRN